MFDLTNNILNIERAEYELNKAYKSNPTAWVGILNMSQKPAE